MAPYTTKYPLRIGHTYPNRLVASVPRSSSTFSWRLKPCQESVLLCPCLPVRGSCPVKSYRISGSSQQISPKDKAVTRKGMLALTPLPLYQSKFNFPYSALGETISGCGRRVEHIAGCWETLGNKPCVLTKGLAYAQHCSYTSTASMMPLPPWPPWWTAFQSVK